MEKVVKNLFGENLPLSEAVTQMNESSPREEVVIIEGKEVPKNIYDLCVKHYLSLQYGD